MWVTGISWFVMLESQIVLPVHTMEAYVRRRGPVPLILNLGTGWREMVNFTHLLLCFRQYLGCPLSRMLSGRDIRSLCRCRDSIPYVPASYLNHYTYCATSIWFCLNTLLNYLRYNIILMWNDKPYVVSVSSVVSLLNFLFHLSFFRIFNSL